MTKVGQDPGLSADAAARLRRFAGSGRFLLGRPRTLAGAPGRLLFLRSLAADDRVTGLWSLDLGTGQERLIANPREVLAGRPEEVPAAESRRRERMRLAMSTSSSATAILGRHSTRTDFHRIRIAVIASRKFLRPCRWH